MELSGHLQAPATVNDRRSPVTQKTAGWVDSSVNTKISFTCGNGNTFFPSSCLHRSHNTDYATSARNKRRIWKKPYINLLSQNRYTRPLILKRHEQIIS